MIRSCFLAKEISTSYKRNNRSTKQKSLRCFPACSSGGHVKGGFCGQALKCQMILDNPYDDDRPINISDYIFIAEIRPNAKAQISAMNTINKAELMSKVRIRQEKEVGVREIFMGEVEILSGTVKELELIVTFNSRHLSWDYSWRSNRWNEEQHVVDIIVLTYSSSTEYAVVSSFTTSSFRIESSHKCGNSNKSSFDDEVLAAKRSRSSDGSSRKVPSAGLSLVKDNLQYVIEEDSDSELINSASHTLSRLSQDSN